MSNVLNLNRTLDLLNQLKSSVQKCIRRADELETDFRLSSGRLDRQIAQAIEQAETRLSSTITEAETLIHAHREHLQLRHEQRRSNLQKARASAQKQRLKLIEAQEGRQIFEAQRGLLQTERTRDSEREQLTRTSGELQDGLAHARETLEHLEKKTRTAFRSYRAFQRLLDAAPEAAPEKEAPDLLSSDPAQLLDQLRTEFEAVNQGLRQFRLSPLALLFGLLPAWLMFVFIAVAHAAVVLAPPQIGLRLTWQQAGVSLLGFLGAIIVLHALGRLLAAKKASRLAARIHRARFLAEAAQTAADTWHQREHERIEADAASKTLFHNQSWQQAVEQAKGMRDDLERRLDEKLARASAKNDALFQGAMERAQHLHDQKIESCRQEVQHERTRLEASRSDQKVRLEAGQQNQWKDLESDWRQTIQSIYDLFAGSRAAAEEHFPDWSAAAWANWTPPQELIPAAPFARLTVDVEQLAGVVLGERRLELPGPSRFVLPLALTFPEQGSILFETKDSGRDGAIGALNNLVLRLLSIAPPGRVVFTILDPLDLGQSFAGLMHLTDHEDRLINRRIWTQPEQIEERLRELNEHIEKVTQLYLRNEYATIADYNQQAGRIAEPYHFLVIADFPVNFSDLALRRLLSIAASGPRCGVFTLIHWDQRKPISPDLAPDDLRKPSVSIRAKAGRFLLSDQGLEGTALALESPPDPQIATALLDKIGRSSVDFNRVEMPFAEIAPEDSALWSVDTTWELRVPIGRTGATKFQYLALGKGTRQHVLIAGKTGSGKSTLFHVLITNLALWCSPDQVEFYLVDFKKGVEFKRYATSRLPHARVVAIESDREFGLSVLERVDQEIRRRGDLFRELGVQDLPGYKRAGGAEKLPRTLLIIDEFHEFFVEDDRVASNAALLLDRLVRQGRAFGIHVLLGSQTLGGAYSLARTTLGQMVVRIALQCNEADALLIMDDTNPAPRLLSRPGEAIFNDAAGALEGNSPFQVVWLSDEERERWLAKIQQRAGQQAIPSPGPIVFEGNAPADVRDNTLLQHQLETPSTHALPAARAWLGAPNSIKGPTEVVFQRQSGSNLLIVGQRDEAALSMIGVALVSLAAHYPSTGARFVVLDVTPPSSHHREFIEKIAGALPHRVTLAGVTDLTAVFAELAEELQKRTDAEILAGAPEVYLVVHDLHRFKALRYEEDFAFGGSEATANPGMQLDQILREGAHLGFHAICSCDSLSSLTRFLSRKAQGEFQFRVLFQMSANDSANLIDSPRAVQLGLHRAILHDGHAGSLETFRPYSLPNSAWIDQAARRLASRA